MGPRAVPAALSAGALLSLLLAAPAQAASLETRDNVFVPIEVVARPGEAVQVLNKGLDHHTVTAVAEGAWAEVKLAPGEQGTFAAPIAPGEHRFYCRFHASPRATPQEGMAGVLRVAPAEEGGPGSPAPAPAKGAPLPLLLPLAALAAAALLRRSRGP
jgi:plastocyanin